MCLAIPAKVVELSSIEERRAVVEVAGVRRQIDTGLLDDDPPKAGDWVLVHVGFAMSKISEQQLKISCNCSRCWANRKPHLRRSEPTAPPAMK